MIFLTQFGVREEYLADYFVNKSIKEDKNATYPISNATLSGSIKDITFAPS